MFLRDTTARYLLKSAAVFSVVVQTGQMLNQIIFRMGQTTLTDEALEDLHRQTPIVSGNAVISEGLGFSVDLKPLQGELVSYRAKPHTGVIDLSKLNFYEPSEFWEEIRTDEGRIILDPGAFYILVSQEAITIPPNCAAEMAPYLAMVGEFRVHYAGFLIRALAILLPEWDHGACLKCAVTKPPLFLNMVRSWDDWSMKR